jgi:spoIIIJ-associated protein
MPAPKEIVEKMLVTLGFQATVEEKTFDGELTLDVNTDDAGRLIGRQGQTLADFQYITNRILFQLDTNAPKVTVDVGGYRSQAREALVKKAKEAAEKVRRASGLERRSRCRNPERRSGRHRQKGFDPPAQAPLKSPAG